MRREEGRAKELTKGELAARRLRATLCYDGTDFRGWQRQRSARSVQGTLEEVLRALTQEDARVVGSGRTDAGVHATAQVAHVDTMWDRPLADLQRALNAELPRDVVVLALDEAPAGFHARHGALWRAYRYTILARPLPDPLRRRTSFHVRRPLDADAMEEAAAVLVGSHDFAAFGRPMTRGGATTRAMHEARVTADGDEVIVAVRANAFLRHQVRRTVGHLVDVGLGRAGSKDTAALLLQGTAAETRPPWRAPAQGLALVGVGYPDDETFEAAARDAEPRETRHGRDE